MLKLERKYPFPGRVGRLESFQELAETESTVVDIKYEVILWAIIIMMQFIHLSI